MCGRDVIKLLTGQIQRTGCAARRGGKGKGEKSGGRDERNAGKKGERGLTVQSQPLVRVAERKGISGFTGYDGGEGLMRQEGLGGRGRNWVLYTMGRK